MKSSSALLCCLVFVFALERIAAMKGWDDIQSVNVARFNCLKENGFEFFIGRVWRSNGRFDTTGIANIKAARAAGWQHVDGYIFPCLSATCAAPAAQMEAAINRLNADGAEIGIIWVDVEPHAWPPDKSANQATVRAMVQKAKDMNVKVGIYTNNNNWEQIVGLSFREFGDLPLWWANWSGNEKFDGFKPFGGWEKPTMRQYVGDARGPCGVSMDMNWYP